MLSGSVAPLATALDGFIEIGRSALAAPIGAGLVAFSPFPALIRTDNILLEWINGELDATADEVAEHFTALFTAAAYAAIQPGEPASQRSGGEQ
jgi:hypothetical protein